MATPAAHSGPAAKHVIPPKAPDTVPSVKESSTTPTQSAQVPHQLNTLDLLFVSNILLKFDSNYPLGFLL